MEISTHKLVLEKALEDMNIIYKKYIMKGMVTADYKIYKLLSHFYSPHKKKLFGNAKTLGLKHYNKAINHFKNGEFKKAYLNLGYACHLLTDLAMPSHSKLSYHYFDSDDLELFIPKNNINIKKIKIEQKENLGDYYEDLAMISSRFPCAKNGLFISLKFKLFNKKNKLPEKELRKQAEYLLPLAVGYCNSFIKKFEDEKNSQG